MEDIPPRMTGLLHVAIICTALVTVMTLVMSGSFQFPVMLGLGRGSHKKPVHVGLNLPQDPYWVGANYYSRFPMAVAAGWTDPAHFPISVFYGKPAHADDLAALGVNTYFLMEDDGSPVTDVTSQGIDLFANIGDLTPAEVGSNPNVPGWFLSDECEMGYSGCSDADLNNDQVIDEYDNILAQQAFHDTFSSYQDGRLAHANFGNGVLRTFWAPNTMDDHVAMMDSVGEDKYAYTSPDVREIIEFSGDWPSGANSNSAGTYGWLQDQMERFMTPGAAKPNYVTVETKMPFLSGEPGSTSITYDQIRGAAWMAIIHGAAGIMYFQHNDDSVCGNVYSLVECEQGLKDAVTALDAKIASLAPVLNSPTLLWNFGAGVDTRLASYNSYAYIFAGVGLNQTTGSKTFNLPSGIRGTSVEVVGESRSLSVSGGQFTDSFAAEYTNHVYKIAL